MKKPLIGIVGRPDIATEKDKGIYVSENYRKAIIEAGGNPLLILPPQDIVYIDNIPKEINHLKEEEKRMIVKQIKLCDGILITGGYQIYEYDCFIADYCIENDIPIIGICMGMQVLGSYFRRQKEYVKITEPNDVNGINHRRKKCKYAHKVEILPDTILSQLFTHKIIKVNSFHRYHVPNALGFTISALSEDGLIEGIELVGKRCVIGIQWHPEVMQKYDEEQKNILSYFIKSCRK